jgi:hypothetical protein
MTNWRSGPDASVDVADNALFKDPLAANTSPRNGHGGGTPVHRDVAGLVGNPLEPGPDSVKSGEVEVAFIGDMGVAIERDVGDGVAVRGEKTLGREMFLYHPQGPIAILHPVLDRMDLQLPSALDEVEPEMRCADAGLQAVLLEEHPCSVSARSMRLSGASGEMPARYHKIAPDSGRKRPGETSNSGTCPFGFLERNSGQMSAPARGQASCRRSPPSHDGTASTTPRAITVILRSDITETLAPGRYSDRLPVTIDGSAPKGMNHAGWSSLSPLPRSLSISP